MRSIYLLLAVIGFIAPNIFSVQESINSGNILLLTNPPATINGMFANTISTAFITDLLVIVLVFFIWTYAEAKKRNIKKVWVIWLLTLVFGMAGPFPLFLYLRESKKP